MAAEGGKSLLQRAKEVASQFEYPPDDVQKGVREFLRLMDVGLQNEDEAMTMIPTYVTDVPNGTEKGVYLAVDLGGTNFRVCSVTLKGDSTFKLEQSKVAIPRELMVSDSHSLFSFLAKQVGEFVKTHHADHFQETKGHRLQLGFTFSFPVDQKAVNRGYLIRWTKGFDVKDAIGKDVCELLQKEIDALGLPVKVAALVNDTVGTLMARSYASPDESGTLIGAIFGTGTNGAYVEKLPQVTKMTKPGADFGEYDTSTGQMVINTEWGSFDNALNVLPVTPYDCELDGISVNPGIQMFEKRVSGMFLGEILRLALQDLKKNAGLFSEASIADDAPVNTPWGVDTSVLSYIEADMTDDLRTSKLVLEEQLGVPAHYVSFDEAKAVKVLVHAIGKRSARLSAVPIAAIIMSTGRLAGEEEFIDIGVDGSVVEFYPGFEKYFREALREVSEFREQGEKRIRMGVAKDGSGVGAALIALVAARMAGAPVKE